MKKLSIIAMIGFAITLTGCGGGGGAAISPTSSFAGNTDNTTDRNHQGIVDLISISLDPPYLSSYLAGSGGSPGTLLVSEFGDSPQGVEPVVSENVRNLRNTGVWRSALGDTGVYEGFSDTGVDVSEGIYNHLGYWLSESYFGVYSTVGGVSSVDDGVISWKDAPLVTAYGYSQGNRNSLDRGNPSAVNGGATWKGISAGAHMRGSGNGYDINHFYGDATLEVDFSTMTADAEFSNFQYEHLAGGSRPQGDIKPMQFNNMPLRDGSYEYNRNNNKLTGQFYGGFQIETGGTFTYFPDGVVNVTDLSQFSDILGETIEARSVIVGAFGAKRVGGITGQ